MRLLRGTHTVLWFIGGRDRLNSHAGELSEDEDHDCYLSVSNLREMAIKVSIGKLDVPPPFTRLVRQHVTGHAIEKNDDFERYPVGIRRRLLSCRPGRPFRLRCRNHRDG